MVTKFEDNSNHKLEHFQVKIWMIVLLEYGTTSSIKYFDAQN